MIAAAYRGANWSLLRLLLQWGADPNIDAGVGHVPVTCGCLLVDVGLDERASVGSLGVGTGSLGVCIKAPLTCGRCAQGQTAGAGSRISYAAAPEVRAWQDASVPDMDPLAYALHNWMPHDLIPRTCLGWGGCGCVCVRARAPARATSTR